MIKHFFHTSVEENKFLPVVFKNLIIETLKQDFKHNMTKGEGKKEKCIQCKEIVELASLPICPQFKK